jgi:hypothetical protein
MSRTGARPSSVHNRRPDARRRLVPLLWIALPALAAVVLWAWRQQHALRPPPPRALPRLVLTSDAAQDRRAILERAADLLVPPGPTTDFVYLRGRNPSVVEIGLELLPLDPARGAEVIRRVIQLIPGSRPQDQTADEIDAPDRTEIGMLVCLARSLRPYPELAASALETAYQEARRNGAAALSLFARVAADVDPARARSAVQHAEAAVAAMPPTAPADPIAAVAAAVARVQGVAAARPLVDRAIWSIPSGPARPLVEARLAARLVNAAPDQARTLARQAVEDVEAKGRRPGALLSSSSGQPDNQLAPPRPLTERKYFGRTLSELRAAVHRKPPSPERPKPRARPFDLAPRQYHDLAVTLAASQPEAALAAVQRIRIPAERAATLIEMANACEAGAPARAEAYYRRALRAAEALPPRPERSIVLSNSAIGLAAYDLTAAHSALAVLPGSPNDLMNMGVRAVGRQPVAARGLIEKAKKLLEKERDSHPASSAPLVPPGPGVPVYTGDLFPSVDVSPDEIFLAEVTTEPDLRRALALAQQAPSHAPGGLSPEQQVESPEPEASALLIVARRLKQHGERERTKERHRERKEQK